MIARALLVTLLLVGGAGVGAAMLLADGTPGAATLVMAAAAAILLVNAIVVLVTYAVALTHASRPEPAQRASAARVAAAMLREFLAHVAVFVVLAPFAWLWARGQPRAPAAGEEPPVLLVHGYLLNDAAWWRFAQLLRREGLAVHAATIEPPLASIDTMAEALAARIAALCAASRASRVHLVAHSMGGLVCRAYLRSHGAARVAALVTIASPHHGTALAGLGLGRCAREMAPGSPWLAALVESERHARHPPAVALFSSYDNYIAPQESARLPWARVGILPTLGHVEMYFSRTVARRVRESLRATGT